MCWREEAQKSKDERHDCHAQDLHLAFQNISSVISKPAKKGPSVTSTQNQSKFHAIPKCAMMYHVYRCISCTSHVHPMYFQVNSSIQFQFLGHRHQIPPRPPTASRSAVFGTHRRGPASNPFPKAFQPMFLPFFNQFCHDSPDLFHHVPSCSIHFFPTSAASSAVANSLYLVISPGSISAKKSRDYVATNLPE